MRLPADFSDTAPARSEVYTIDFARDLGSGDSIASAVWQIISPTRADEAAASRAVGDPVIVGTTVSQTAVGLRSGVQYVMRALVTTTQGNSISLFSHVRSV